MKIKFTLVIIAVIFFDMKFTNAQPREVTVALCQIFSLDGDRPGNFRRIENAIIEAKDKGADIVAFPETSILGWVNPDAHEIAYPIPGEDSNILCNLAKKYSIHITIGLAEKSGEKLYDSAILIDDSGSILLKHRKINILTELMSPSYTGGDEVNTVDTRFGRIGLLICADSFRKELRERMKNKKPDILFIPYGWAAKVDEWPEHGKELENVVRKIAIEVGCPVIGTDLVGQISHGPWKGQTYGGQSIAVSEDGAIIAKGKDRDRDILIVSLPKK